MLWCFGLLLSIACDCAVASIKSVALVLFFCCLNVCLRIWLLDKWFVFLFLLCWLTCLLLVWYGLRCLLCLVFVFECLVSLVMVGLLGVNLWAWVFVGYDGCFFDFGVALVFACGLLVSFLIGFVGRYLLCLIVISLF